MMRYLLTLFSFLTIHLCMNADALPKAPDFAYPQTVAKEAKSDLKKAQKDGDAHAALNALIRLYLAETIVDPQKAQEGLNTVAEATDQFANSPLQGLFYALQAKICYGIYANNRWTYDRRQLPLTPLPEDMTEWSGDQFKARINELCQKSCDNPSTLANLPTKDYPDIVTADSLTLTYYPTLLDFACANAAALCGQTGQESKPYLNIGLANAAPASPSAILWVYTLCQSSANPRAELLKAYQAYKNSEYSSLLLLGIYQASNDDFSLYYSSVYDDEEDVTDDQRQETKRQTYNLIENFISRYPEAPLRDNLLNAKAELSRTSISISYPSLVAPGKPLQVKVTNANAQHIILDVYAVSDKLAKTNNYFSVKTFNKQKPVKSFTLNDSTAIPFKNRLTFTIGLETPGYYAIVPRSANETSASDEYVILTRCIPILPITVSSHEQSMAIVADATSGLPAQGAVVSVVSHKGTAKAGTVDAQGMTNLTKSLNDQAKNQWIKVNYQGKDYEFDRVLSDLIKNNSETENLQAQVLTDRALYHPGETLNVLAIISRTHRDANGLETCSIASDVPIKLTLKDANYQDAGEISGTTDAFGRISGQFSLPTEGLTGQFSILAKSARGNIGSTSVTVSDYKLPDFRLDDIAVQRDTPAKGAVTITGQAMTYAKTPVAGANVNAIISTATWWRWFSPQEEIYSTDVTTDAQGRFTIELADSVFADQEDKYFIAKLLCTSLTGTTANGAALFSLGKPYQIDISLDNQTIDISKPLALDAKAYDPNGEVVDIPLKWTLINGTDTVAEGNLSGAIDLTKVTPGYYTLSIAPVDAQLADAAKTDITLYNPKSKIVPDRSPIFVPENSFTLPYGDVATQVSVLYGTPGSVTAVYYALSDLAQLRLCKMERVETGYHTLKVDIPADFPGGLLTLMAVKDCQVYSCTVNLTRTAKSALKIQAESFRDRLVPQSEETWKITITDADGQPVEAALALDMYNQALDALEYHSFGVRFPSMRPSSRVRFSSPGYLNYSVSFNANLARLNYEELEAPEFNFYGLNPGYGRSYMRFSKSSRVRSSNAYADMAVEELAMPMMVGSAKSESIEEEATVTADNALTEDKGIEPQLPAADEQFDYRDAEVPLAIWAPMLTTDSDGNVSYTFTVPNANATWRLAATAWTQGLEVGNLVRDLVASKPVMVMPNTPRFLREGDKCVLTASIINNTDSVSAISGSIEVFNPATSEVIASYPFSFDIEANSSQVATADISVAVGTASLGLRCRATNGQFSDGEQSVIPVLSSQAALIETYPFYLNPGDTVYTTTLPSAKDARISLTFCENPAWTIVSALPGLRSLDRSDANSAAAAIFSAAVARGILKDNLAMADALKHWAEDPSDSTLVSMLEKNEDLKQAMLNCTPWVQAAQSDTERMAALSLIFDQKETDQAIAKATEVLKKLQRADGGWAWCDWIDQSSYWVTMNVLDIFANLKTTGWMPADSTLIEMITNALDWIDDEIGETAKYGGTDLLYTLVRPRFTEQPISKNGQTVIKATLKEINKNWKKYTDPAYKAMAAEALYLNDNEKKAHELMSSISEFGVWTKDQGLRFPSVNALYNYGILLEAYAMIEPESKEVDGLRQQLIVRKQGSDWGQAVVTTQVVASILSSGSCWTVPAQGAEVRAGSTVIEPESPIAHATGCLRANLSDHGGEELQISTPGVGPAYGAVYAQFKQLMDEVKSSSCDDLSIEKQITVRRGTEWEYPTAPLSVGDRVKVVLTIHCKRNLDYVTIIDERPAGFEPADQLPGWMWSEGVGFYRENRDAFTGIYVERMYPGTYQLTYELNVSLAGQFLSGVATVQSQYAPELSAHSSGSLLEVKPSLTTP